MEWRFTSASVIDAQANVLGLRSRVTLLERKHAAKSSAAIANQVRRLLTEAEAAATASKKEISWWQRHWHCSHIQAAFQTYHAARVVAVGLYDERDIAIELPGAIAEAKARLGPDDKRIAAAEKLVDEKSMTAKRAWLQQLVRENYDASDDAHRRLLQLRNVLVIATVGVFVLMAVTTLAFAKAPEWAPLCFDGDQPLPESAQVEVVEDPAAGQQIDQGSLETVEQTTVCPTDEGTEVTSQTEDVLAVVLMGFIGGSFAAVLAVRNIGATSSPFRVAVVLAILKSPTGALTALAGLIAIRGNFVPGLSDLDSPEQILAYALVLGYAQQLATGFLDRRAKEIADKT